MRHSEIQMINSLLGVFFQSALSSVSIRENAQLNDIKNLDIETGEPDHNKSRAGFKSK